MDYKERIGVLEKQIILRKEDNKLDRIHINKLKHEERMAIDTQFDFGIEIFGLNEKNDELKKKISLHNETINNIMQVIFGEDEDSIKIYTIKNILFTDTGSNRVVEDGDLKNLKITLNDLEIEKDIKNSNINNCKQCIDNYIKYSSISLNDFKSNNINEIFYLCKKHYIIFLDKDKKIN